MIRKLNSFHLFLAVTLIVGFSIWFLILNTDGLKLSTKYLDQLKSMIPLKDLEETNLKNSADFDELIRDHCPVENLKIGYTCLEKLQEFKIYPNAFKKTVPVMLYHTFWRVDESKPHQLRVLILQILSFLATQDIAQSKFIIWIQNPFSENINKVLSKKFHYYFNTSIVEIRILNFEELCSQGLFKLRYNECSSTTNYNSVAFSDFIRFLVLYKYGGIYTDGDVFYLRDMRPFWNKNFVHRWSFTGYYNTAVMGLQLNRSNTVDSIYAHILKTNDIKVNIDLISGFHPEQVATSVSQLNPGNVYHYNDFECYHSILFDPAWLCNDGKKFKNCFNFV